MCLRYVLMCCVSNDISHSVTKSVFFIKITTKYLCFSSYFIDTRHLFRIFFIYRLEVHFSFFLSCVAEPIFYSILDIKR